MPDLGWNMNMWRQEYDWNESKGEEWSQCWGSSVTQWVATLYPRIHRFLPCGNILEIAPGFGRWTKFLLAAATKTYRAVDLSESCAKYCQETYSPRHSDFKAFSNDGMSLDSVGGLTYDFIFSFDSLVHVNLTVLGEYIQQILGSLLSSNGVVFLHHSNMKFAKKFNQHLTEDHCRDPHVSTEDVAEIIEHHNGKILMQEIISWGNTTYLDALTLFCHKGCKFQPPQNPYHYNADYMAEAEYVKNTFEKYNFK